MDNAAVVKGEFVTFKHVKTRKTFTIEIEFPEEQGRMVLDTLGMPIGGESKPVAVALLDNSIVTKPEINCDRTEGEKLRTRAVLLCRDADFQKFARDGFTIGSGVDRYVFRAEECSEWGATDFIYGYCSIESRAELTVDVKARYKFKEILERYKNWQAEQQYSDNLSRI